MRLTIRIEQHRFGIMGGTIVVGVAATTDTTVSLLERSNDAELIQNSEENFGVCAYKASQSVGGGNEHWF